MKNEKEVGVELQLQVTRLEEEMGRANQELATSVSLRDTALEEVKNEKEAKQVLNTVIANGHFWHVHQSAYVQCS